MKGAVFFRRAHHSENCSKYLPGDWSQEPLSIMFFGCTLYGFR